MILKILSNTSMTVVAGAWAIFLALNIRIYIEPSVQKITCLVLLLLTKLECALCLTKSSVFLS